MTAPRIRLRAFTQARVGRLCLLFAAELILLAAAYQFLADISCYQLELGGMCSFLRSLVARAIIILAVSVVLVWAWPAAFSRFAAAVETHRRARWARGLHFVGLALLFGPLVMAWGRDLGAMFDLALWPWLAGAVLAAGGGLFWLASGREWRALLATDRFAMVPILTAAALLPDVAEALRPLWDWSVLAQATFAAVAWVLRLFADGVYVDPSALNIGILTLSSQFVVQVGQPCSGVEGFALVTAFVAIYGYVFRRDLILSRYWLVVLPLGLLASWLLNVVRITALILIGARVSPELAVNGFHSYAGWLFFTLLALALIWGVQMTPWLHRGGRVPKPGLPLRQDLTAAFILPFVALMLAGSALSALLIQPELGYPVKVLVMAGTLALFAPAFRALPWEWDWLAVGVGAAVGAVWVATAAPANAGLAADLGNLPALALWAWILMRVIGTVLLIPVIEEAFFRGYLLTRLDGPTPARRAVAIAVSSAAFAVLHGRWLVAGLAGAMFAAVYLRRGRLGDAIIAHGVANLIVAMAALIRADFSLI